MRFGRSSSAGSAGKLKKPGREGEDGEDARDGESGQKPRDEVRRGAPRQERERRRRAAKQGDEKQNRDEAARAVRPVSAGGKRLIAHGRPSGASKSANPDRRIRASSIARVEAFADSHWRSKNL